MLERPWVRTLITWAVALAVYLGVRFVEAFDIHRMLPRDDHALEARADQLAAHVTATVGRARDLERARVAGLCQALAHEPDAARLPHLVSSAVSQSNLAELTVLVPDATGDAPVAYDYVPGRGAARSIHWNDALAEALPAAPAPGRTSGIDDDLAAIIPASGLALSAGLGVIRMGCRATSSGGRAHVVVAYLDVLTVAELALPETVASVALETESSRSPGLRRWLGPADGDAPRPALRVPVGAAPIRASTAFAPLIAAIVSALGVFFALRPKKSSGAVLGTLEAAAERVGRGDLEVMLAAEGGAADGTFTAFNRMTRDLKDARARLVRAERVAAWRDVARRIAHEIKNPLTPIRMAIETLRKAKQRQHPDLDDIFEESTVAVLEEVGRMERIVSEFSRFARMPRPKATSLDLTEVAQHVVQVHALPAEVTQPEGEAAAQVKLEVDGELGAVRADREQIIQVLTNLVQNGIDAAKQKTPEHPRVLVRLAKEESGVRLEVHDNGPGLHTDEHAQVLEPYYTTKEKGTGLGLAIVDRIVADHGGTLSIGTSEVLGGACFTILLRREGPPEEASSSRPSQP